MEVRAIELGVPPATRVAESRSLQSGEPALQLTTQQLHSLLPCETLGYKKYPCGSGRYDSGAEIADLQHPGVAARNQEGMVQKMSVSEQ